MLLLSIMRSRRADLFIHTAEGCYEAGKTGHKLRVFMSNIGAVLDTLFPLGSICVSELGVCSLSV